MSTYDKIVETIVLIDQEDKERFADAQLAKEAVAHVLKHLKKCSGTNPLLSLMEMKVKDRQSMPCKRLIELSMRKLLKLTGIMLRTNRGVQLYLMMTGNVPRMVIPRQVPERISLGRRLNPV